MQKTICILLLLLLVAYSPVWAQSVNLSGSLTDPSFTDPVVGANVYLKGTTLGTITDKSGSFTIRNIKSGNYELIISCVGFKRIKESLCLKSDTTMSAVSMEKSSSALGEVVVTGTGTPHHLKSAPVQTELINNKLIEQIAPSSFSDLMMAVSPSFDFSPSTMGSFMQLNGLGNDYILVLIDGKRVYGDIGGQTDLTRINPENISRIEVVKGASSALYGSEAIGGVINVITKKQGNKINAQNSSRIGSFGEWVQHNSLDLNVGRFSSTTSFDRAETDGWQLSKYEISDDKLVETEALAQNPSENYTIAQKLSYSVTQKMSVYLQGAAFEHNVDRPVSVGNYGYYYKDFNYSAGAKYLLNDDCYIEADWNSDKFKYYFKYNQDYKTYIKGQEELQTAQTRDLFNVKGVFKISKNNQFTIGSEYVNEELESEGRLVVDGVDVYTFAAYVQDELTVLKNLDIVFGFRYINHKEFGNAYTPKMSALYKFNKINFRATYARGFKAPTLKELYYHYEKKGGSLFLGNTDLTPQSSPYYAGSVEYNTKNISLSFTAYQNSVKDLIDYQTVETSEEDAANGIKNTRQHFNIAKAGTKGLDFIFDINMGAGFTIGGGYSYVDAKNETNDLRLENVAHNYANIRLGYIYKWKKYHLGANISGRYQDEKFYEDGNAKEYNIWKLTTSHRIITKGSFNIEATAGIDNVFDYVDDSPYGSHYGTINPGRTYFAGVTIGFSK